MRYLYLLYINITFNFSKNTHHPGGQKIVRNSIANPAPQARKKNSKNIHRQGGKKSVQNPAPNPAP